MKYFTSTLAVTAATFVLQGCKKEEKNNEQNPGRQPTQPLNSRINAPTQSEQTLQQNLQDIQNQINHNDFVNKTDEEKKKLADDFVKVNAVELKKKLTTNVNSDLAAAIEKFVNSDSENVKAKWEAGETIALGLLETIGVPAADLNKIVNDVKKVNEVDLRQKEHVETVVNVLQDEVFPVLKKIAEKFSVENELLALTDAVWPVIQAIPANHAQIVKLITDEKLDELEILVFGEANGKGAWKKLLIDVPTKWLKLKCAFLDNAPTTLNALADIGLDKGAASLFTFGLMNHQVRQDVVGVWSNFVDYATNLGLPFDYRYEEREQQEPEQKK